MKFSVLFLIISTLSILNSSLSSNFVKALSSQEDSFFESICTIVNDVIGTRNDTQDILIGHIGGNRWSPAVNDVIQCIDTDKAVVVVTDFLTVLTEQNLRKASVIVLISHQSNSEMITKLITRNFYSTVLHNMAKVICIVPSYATLKQRISFLRALILFGIYDVTVVHKNSNQDAQFEIVQSRVTGTVGTFLNPNDISEIFPDKLKDMSGYPLKIPVVSQPPLVKISNGIVKSPMLHFVEIVRKAMNMTTQLAVVKDAYFFKNMWINRQMQLLINTAVLFDNKFPKLMNYEKIGFCALVPIPPKVSAFRILVIMPFDYPIWTPLVLSIAGSVLVWWMYRGRGAVDSHWLLLAEIYKMFFSQGFTLSRNNHFMLLTLMQLLCWLIFIISNAYESEITSCMIEPFHEKRLEAVDDLLASNYEIATDEGFAFIINSNDGFEGLKSKIKRTDLHIPERFIAEIKLNRSVIINMCDSLENIINFRYHNKQLSDHFYMLPEIVLWDFVRLETSPFNPYVERFQFYMDLSFQAGLPNMWKVFESQDRLRYKEDQSSAIMDSLGFEDVRQVFIILIALLGLSLVVLVCEIFYHDCLSHIRVTDGLNCIRQKVRQLISKSKKKPVKIVQVRPRN